MFVVVPVVFEAGLACLLKVFEGEVLVVNRRSASGYHVCEIATKSHGVGFAGFTLGFGQCHEVVQFALVILDIMDRRVGHFFYFWVCERQFPMIGFLGSKVSWRFLVCSVARPPSWFRQ
jgi:hypothetical protein